MLQQAGLEWISKNLGGFVNDTERGKKAVGSVGDTAGKSKSGFDIMNGAVMGIANSITTHLIDAATKAVMALGGMVQQSVGLAGQFQGMTTGLQIAGRAAAEAAGVPLESLGEIALQVGGDTRLLGVSATGAADAMTGMLKNGMSLTEVMGDVNGYMAEGAQLGGALRAAIDLAAATELDMVQASDLAAITLNTFGSELKTEAERAEFVNAAMDNYVKTADASVASVTELSDAMKNIGPVAAMYGFSLEDTNTALAILSSRGIKGAEAGTALKSMMTNLNRATPQVVDSLSQYGISLYDNEGKMYDLVNIMGQFEAATGTMTDKQRDQFIQTVAGTYGMKSLATLLKEGVVGWEDMSTAISNATGIQAQAEARASTFSGRMEALQGNLETLKIRAGSALLPALTNLTGWFSEMVSKHEPAITAAFEKVGDVLTLVSQAITGEVSWDQLLPPWVISTAEGIGTAFQNIMSAVDEAKVALQDMTAGLEPGEMLSLRDVLEGVSEAVNNFIPQPLIDGFFKIYDAVAPLVEQFITWISENVELNDVLAVVAGLLIAASGPLLAAVAAAAQAVAIFGLLVGAVALIRQAWETDFLGIQTTITGLIDMIIAFPETLAVWGENWEMFKQILGQVWTGIQEAVASVLDTIKNLWTVNDSSIWEDISTIWGGVMDFIGTVMGAIIAIVSSILGAVLSVWTTIFTAVYEFIMGWWESFAEFWAAAWEVFRSIIAGVLGVVQGIISGALSIFQSIFDIGFNAIVAIVDTIMQQFRLVINAIANLVRGDFDTFIADVKKVISLGWENLKTITKTAFTTIMETIKEIWEKIKTAISTAIDNIKKAFTSVDWKELGTSIIEGIKKGIVDAAKSLAKAAADAAKKALEAAKSFLRGHSPSERARDEIGLSFGEGFRLGILDAIPGIQAAAAAAASAALGAVPAAPLVLAASAAGSGVINNNATNVTVNAAYSQVQSPASVGYDVRAALAAATL